MAREQERDLWLHSVDDRACSNSIRQVCGQITDASGRRTDIAADDGRDIGAKRGERLTQVAGEESAPASHQYAPAR